MKYLLWVLVIICFGLLSCGKDGLDRSMNVDEVSYHFGECPERFTFYGSISFGDIIPQSFGIVLTPLSSEREPTIDDINIPATVSYSGLRDYRFNVIPSGIDRTIGYKVRAYAISPENEDVTYGPSFCVDVETWSSEKSTTSISITRLSDFPGTPVGEAVAFTANGKGYICGGYDGDNDLFVNAFWEYDPVLDSWEQLPDYPGQLGAFYTSFVYGEYAYIAFGGRSPDGGTNEVYKYHLIDETWTSISVPSFNGPQAGVSMVIDSIVYFYNFAGDNSNLIIEFNLAKGNWRSKRSDSYIITNKARNMSATIDTIGYFIDTELNGRTTMKKFNPSDNNFTELNTFRFTSNDGLAFVVNNNIYIVTGRGLEGHILEYDPDTNSSYAICNDQDPTNSIQRSEADSIQRSEAVGFVFDNEIIITNGIEYNLDSDVHTNGLRSTFKITID